MYTIADGALLLLYVTWFSMFISFHLIGSHRRSVGQLCFESWRFSRSEVGLVTEEESNFALNDKKAIIYKSVQLLRFFITLEIVLVKVVHGASHGFPELYFAIRLSGRHHSRLVPRERIHNLLCYHQIVPSRTQEYTCTSNYCIWQFFSSSYQYWTISPLPTYTTLLQTCYSLLCLNYL